MKKSLKIREARLDEIESEFLPLLVPDMNAFTIVDEILAGNRVPWAHALNLLGYASAYTVVLLVVSELIFEFREI